jgi:hypothetical protein
MHLETPQQPKQRCRGGGSSSSSSRPSSSSSSPSSSSFVAAAARSLDRPILRSWIGPHTLAVSHSLSVEYRLQREAVQLPVASLGPRGSGRRVVAMLTNTIVDLLVGVRYSTSRQSLSSHTSLSSLPRQKGTGGNVRGGHQLGIPA